MSIPDLDKIIKMSNIFGVSTDYLLKDELEEILPAEETKAAEKESVCSISIEAANEYMNIVRKVSSKIALGVVFCILSPICLIWLGGLSEYGNVGLTEDMAGGIGVAILLVLITIGVVILILNSMQLSKYDYLEKEPISLEYGVKGVVEKRKKEFESKYQQGIAFGTAFCILGVIPLMIAAGMEAGDYVYILCTCALFCFIACGVYLFIYTGMIWGSFTKLLQEGDYTEEKKAVEKKTSLFSEIYWCIITAIYLGISFYSFEWHRTWIIWPVAGVLFAACQGILKMVMVNSKTVGKQ